MQECAFYEGFRWDCVRRDPASSSGFRGVVPDAERADGLALVVDGVERFDRLEKSHGILECKRLVLTSRSATMPAIATANISFGLAKRS